MFSETTSMARARCPNVIALLLEMKDLWGQKDLLEFLRSTFQGSFKTCSSSRKTSFQLYLDLAFLCKMCAEIHQQKPDQTACIYIYNCISRRSSYILYMYILIFNTIYTTYIYIYDITRYICQNYHSFHVISLLTQ